MNTIERVEVPDALMGKPDGPFVFVPELGVEVPTYVDPRQDLIMPKARGFKRLSHHIPFNMRGEFKPQWLPPRYYAMYGHQYETDTEGYALCHGKTKDGSQCKCKAVNRSPYCPNHGGALHPADKKLSAQNVAIEYVEQERIENLDRVQQFMSGLISVSDLDDDEIIGAYVRNNEGRPIINKKLGAKFQQQMTQELIRRMHRLMQMKLPNMIKAMIDIAESDFAEPADRIRASQYVIDRVMGKTPDVVFHGGTDQPYEAILSGITLEGGSREDYRRGVLSSRPDQKPLDVAVVDDETELEPNGDFGSNGDSNGNDLRGTVSDDAHAISGNQDTGPVVNGVSRVDDAKEAKERLKRAKTRRFAARSQGIIHGDPAWLLEYIELKSGGFKVKVYPPELQTEAVIDRIKTKQIGA